MVFQLVKSHVAQEGKEEEVTNFPKFFVIFCLNNLFRRYESCDNERMLREVRLLQAKTGER